MTRQEKRDAWVRIVFWALVYTGMIITAMSVGVEG